MSNGLGQEVVALVDGVQEARYKSVKWGANQLASWVYFYRLTAQDFIQTSPYLMGEVKNGGFHR